MRAAKAAPALLLVPLALALAGCGAEQTPSMFRAESTAAQDIRTLTFILFAILSGILIFVWAWLFLAILRNRRRPESQVKQSHGNLTVEFVWTLIPAVIVAVLFYLTLSTTEALTTNVPRQVDIKVTGYQWWWGVEYRSGKFATANEIHVPVDRTVALDLASADVIHSFWVPQMGGKLDMVPGRINTIHFLPTKAGEYIGECSEFCGHQHGRMRFLLVVEPVEDFTEWFANQRRPAVTPTGEPAVAGQTTITKLPCVGCHTIRGNDAMRGVTGPDLTHVASRSSLAALTIDNTPDEMRRWLRDPQKVKPANLMPAVPLTPRQLDELVAYLEALE